MAAGLLAYQKDLAYFCACSPDLGLMDEMKPSNLAGSLLSHLLDGVRSVM